MTAVAINIKDLEKQTPTPTLNVVGVDSSTNTTVLADIDDIKAYVLAGIGGGSVVDGKSAYDLAVEDGFEGTLSEWLLSLKGENGKTAYALAVEGGFSGTQQQWLDSLKGESATISVGTVTTGAAGTNAAVVNVGTPSAAVLNFTIPRGAAGDGSATVVANVMYDTVAAMIADTALEAGLTVGTRGYWVEGDGGATQYLIVASGTGTADGGNYINLTNGLQAKAVFFGTKLNLSQFGAKGKYSKTSTPLSLGSWTNPEPGVFYLNWDGVSTYSPLTFSTVVDGTYLLNLFRISSLKSAGVYDLQFVHGAGGTGNSIGNLAAWARSISAAGATAAKTTYMSILPIGTSPIEVKFKNVIFYRVDNDMPALTAALTFFNGKSGTLVMDSCSYFNITSSGITIPENVNLEFSNPGVMAFNTSNKTLTIDSSISAENRPIFPKHATVMFSSRQKSVISNWFGV